MQVPNILNILIEGASFLAAFAAITSAFMMSSVKKKFGTGILATGFKTISVGVFFIAIGIVLDAINSYIQLSGIVVTTLLVIKEILFVLGTYIIVIGSKQTGDKLESLTK